MKRQVIVSFLSGALFAAGLGVAGMTNPAKVMAFLDVTGAWDPSLAFVMVGAIAVYAVAFRLAIRRPAPLLAEAFSLPKKGDLDAPLIAGAALFGAGWGLAGYCPGPAITSLATGAPGVFLFVASMLAGMVIHRAYEVVRTAPPQGAAQGSPAR
jgi:uncharacterized membrane protein YedE/YeeE